MDSVPTSQTRRTRRETHSGSQPVGPIAIQTPANLTSVDSVSNEPPRTNEQRVAVSGPKNEFRQIELLSEAAARFSLELDLHKLFDSIAHFAAKLLRAERVIAWSVVGGRLTREAWLPPSDTSWPPVESLPPEGMRAYKHLEPVLTRATLGQCSSLRNAIYVPLVGTQSRLLGMIELQNKGRGAFFSEEDLRTATCLARVATSAVDRAGLFARIEEWSHSIELLLSFNATVNQHLQPQEMVRQLVVNATGFIDADGGVAGVAIDTEAGRAMASDGIYYSANWFPHKRHWLVGQGIPGTVLQTEFPLLIDNYAVHPLADPELGRRFAIGSCICVAIKNAAECVLGFFKLYRREGKPAFTWQEAAVLESLGNTAAVAIENAALVKSLEMKNEQVKNLSAAHVRRLEEERRHIARELHDETGQVLVGLKLRLQLLARSLPPEQGLAKLQLDDLREQVGEATVRLKELAKHLRPPTLDELGFEATVRQLIADYNRQVLFDVDFEVDVGSWITSDAETALYRILQESLTNIVKHADAQHVSIRFGQVDGEAPFLVIEDDGRGFDPQQHTAGLGLIGIRERVKMLGATIDVRSIKGSGTRIEIRQIPYEHEEASHSGG